MSSDTGVKAWKSRSTGVFSWFNTNRKPIVCCQECTVKQKTDILSNCGSYGCISYSIPADWPWQDDDMAPVAIFYDKNLISVSQSGFFWLVDGAPVTPTKYSGSKHTRCTAWFRCTYAGHKLLVLDTHLSYVTSDGQYSGTKMQSLREYEMNVISKWLEKNYDKNSGENMILVGDFNIDQGNSIFDRYKDDKIGDLAKYARKKSKGWTDFGRTYNAWGDESAQLTIDHQFYWGFSGVQDYLIDRDAYAGVQYISDHWPVTAKYIF